MSTNTGEARAAFLKSIQSLLEKISTLKTCVIDNPDIPPREDTIARIRSELQRALWAICDAEMAEVNNDVDMSDNDKTKARGAIQSRINKHCKKRRKVGIQTVRDSHGTIFTDQDAADRHLTQHWAGKFQHTGVDLEEAQGFIGAHSRS